MILLDFYNLFDVYTACLGAVVFIIIYCAIRSKEKKKNFPPGPTGLPVVGYLPFAATNPGDTFMKLKKRYGNVMSVKMGPDVWIVLNDYETIHEAFVKRGEVFSGRPKNEVFDIIAGGKGVIMSDYGNTWKSLRKFGLTTLRGFGVGKKGMEDNIIDETPLLIKSLIDNEDKTSFRMKIMYAVSNIICRVVFGSRFEYDDEDFKILIEILTNATSDTWEAKVLGLVFVAPALKHLPFFNSAMSTINAEIEKFFDVFRKRISDHKSSYDKNDMRDFIDAFLKEMNERADDPAFCDAQLLQYIRDLFEAGSGTTTSTLNWMIFAFLHFPECQQKIYKEVETVIGESGTPSMKHRDEMPYTCAFIQEIMRYKPLLPLGVSHKNNEEVTLNGYTIPKNSVVVGNFWAVHYDPELFPNPTEFRPERFLDEDGKFVKSNHVIPFSIGPRHCLGEQLARMEIFIFLTGIVQKLKILPDPAHSLPPFESGVYNMIFYDAKDFKAVFERR